MRRKRIVRKIKKNGGVIISALAVGFALGVLVSLTIPASSTTPSTTLMNYNTSKAADTVNAEYIFTHICMKCHITPTKYKSFTTYFGKPAAVWKIGVNKMVSAGNVRLNPKQIDEVASYLAKRFGGGK